MGIYESQAYSSLSENEIFGRLTCEGHRPTCVVERPGSVYDGHKNTYDLVLAFLYGAADIRVGDHVYHCVAGDRLNIPGSQMHSAVVTDLGVVYLMTQVVNCAD